MGITSWVKSFTVLELVLSFLIIILAIICAIWLTYFLTDDSKSENTTPSVIDFNITNDDNETDSFFRAGVLSGLNDTVLDITPKHVLTEYKEYANRNKSIRISSTGRINTHQNYTYVTALLNINKPDKEKCSCLIFSEQFAITSATCSKRIKMYKDYVFLEFTNANGKIEISKTNELTKVMVHHQYKEGSEQYDVAVLKSAMKFKLPQECYARLLSPIAAKMVKVGDAVVIVAWNMTEIKTNEHVRSVLLPFAIATFVTHDAKLMDWCTYTYDHNVMDDTKYGHSCGFNRDPKIVGAPVFKGHAAYALVGGNEKLVILADHLDWFEVSME